MTTAWRTLGDDIVAKIRRQWLRLLVLAGCYAGLAYAVHRLLPPAPRLTLDIDAFGTLTADGERFLAPIASSNPEQPVTGPINVWNTRTGRIVASYLTDGGAFMRGLLSEPDDRFLTVVRQTGLTVIDLVEQREWTVPRSDMGPAAAGPPVKVHSLPTGFLVLRFPGAVLVLEKGDSTPLLAVKAEFAFSPDGRRLFLDEWSGTAVWDLTQRRLERNVPRMHGPYLFSKDGRHLATSYLDANDVWKAALWELPDLTRRALVAPDVVHLIDRPRLMLSPDDRWLSIWFSNVQGTKTLGVDFLDVAAGEVIERRGDALQMMPYRFSPDGQAVALVSDDKRVMSVAALPSLETLWQFPSEKPTIATKFMGTHVPSSTIMINDVEAREIVFLDWHTGQRRGGRIQQPDEPSFLALSRQELDLSDEPSIWYLQPREHLPPASGWRARLQEWFPPLGWNEVMMVADLPSGETLLAVKRPRNSWPQLSNDGQTLLVGYPLESGATRHYRYEVWDVPPDPRWRWVLGVPTGMFMLILLVRAGWRRTKPGARF